MLLGDVLEALRSVTDDLSHSVAFTREHVLPVVAPYWHTGLDHARRDPSLLFAGGLVLVLLRVVPFLAHSRSPRLGASVRPSTDPHPSGGGSSEASETDAQPGARGLMPRLLRLGRGAGGWQTGHDFAESPLGPTAPVLLGSTYLPLRCVVAILAAPKMGKSRFYVDMVGCIVRGVPFWGLPVVPGPVVVMGEESADEYRDKALIAAGGLSRVAQPWYVRLRHRAHRRLLLSLPGWWCRRVLPHDVHVVCGPDRREDRTVGNFRLRLEEAARRAKKVGARLLVVDSLTFWVDGSQTNVQRAIEAARACKSVANRYRLCVCVVYHASEKTGKALGPTSWFSQLAQRATIGTPEDKPPDKTTARTITWQGRFKGLAPDPWVYRMDEGDVLVPLSVPGVEGGTGPATSAGGLPPAAEPPGGRGRPNLRVLRGGQQTPAASGSGLGDDVLAWVRSAPVPAGGWTRAGLVKGLIDAKVCKREAAYRRVGELTQRGILGPGAEGRLVLAPAPGERREGEGT